MIYTIGDIQLRWTNPISRLDEFRVTQFSKLKEIFSLAKLEDTIVTVGDVFDDPVPTMRLVNQFIGFLDAFDATVFTVIGNHDVYGGNSEALDRSALGVLVNSGFIKLIPQDGIDLGNSIWLSGCNVDQNIPPRPSDAETAILVVHRPIFPPAMDPMITPYCKPQDLEAYGYDIVLCGDYHYPFWEQCGKTLVYNTGALMRETASDTNMHRSPSYSTIDRRTVTVHPIKCAQPADKVLTREHLDNVVQIASMAEDFTAILQMVGGLGGEPIQLLMAAMETANLDQKTKDLIKMTITEAQLANE